MSVSRGSSGRTGGASTGRGKGQARRPNRSQARAIEARARTVPVADAGVAVPAAATVETPPAPARGSARTRPIQRTRSVARPVALSRHEEYAFIRADLRRLVMTASLLLLAMLVLLVAIEL